MSFPTFGEFFAAAHDGWKPFPWQAKLAETVAADGWPEAVQVPTGLGKTAVVDVATWVLASEADRAAGDRRAPMRVFYVVDRRLVVDQAYDHASRLSERLEDARDGPLAEMARALRSLGEPVTALGERVLTVTRMRGGTTWATRWIRRPDLPAVVVGTVDQIGSRALFRGYGVGRRRLPIDAALVATDSLVVVDEVHLSLPFVETVSAFSKIEARAEQPVRRPLTLVRMSATLPAGRSPELVGDADRRNDVAGPRLLASKRVRLVTTPKKAAVDVLAGLARAHLGTERAPRADTVAVVVNTVALARDVFDRLGAGRDAALLVGRVRPADRDRVAAGIESFKAGATRSDVAPHILVATQTVEVGVDLDVGALVSQAAPLDSLVQRMGRLDRFGGRVVTEATLVHVTGEDLVYGAPATETWNELTRLAGVPAELLRPPSDLVELGEPELDFGVGALEKELAGVDRRPLVAHSASPPVVVAPILDVWARTSPVPVPDEPVAPYLHGRDRPSPLVAVSWRAVPPGEVEETERALQRSLEMVSLRGEEQVEVPLWEALALLEGRQVSVNADVAVAVPPEDARDEGGFRHACVRLEDDGPKPCRRRADVQPGALLVLPSSVGGYDRWGWTGRSGGLVPDVADFCAPYGTLRLAREVLESNGLGALDPTELREAIRAHGRPDGDDDSDALQAGLTGALDALRELAATVPDVHPRLESLLGELSRAAERSDGLQCGGLTELPGRGVLLAADDDSVIVRWVVRTRRDGGLALELDDAPVGGDAGRASTSRTGQRVELSAHSREVGARAGEMARRVGIDGRAARAVELAALAHDVGKADPRFQRSLWGGDRLAMEADGRLLAKSGQLRGRHTIDWPRGMRHEALSGSAVPLLLEAIGAADVDVELAQHLVLSHHGYARPLLPPVDTQEPVAFAIPLLEGDGTISLPGVESQVDWEHPRRFRELCHRYGWWGLALLELVVRSADTCVSEEEARAPGEGP